MSNSRLNYWIVGSAFARSDDQTARFLAEGTWEISNPPEPDRALVKAMRPGDRIAIKSTFVQKHGLPFDVHGQSVSVLRIKARGTITQNQGDGERVSVDWDRRYDGADWYFYTFRSTIWQLPTGIEEAQRLIAFIFSDQPQDYEWFLAQPYWRDKYLTTEMPKTPSVWIEKTLVTGRVDREVGEHALGRALWSPKTSKSGGDIYANMRRVEPGDIVLHLTDNRGFTGISIAAERADDTFEGLVGTEWEGPCYRIALQDYVDLQPPLLRDQLFKTEPFAAELAELVESGAKGLFFNRKLELNQGAYLTEVTPTLLAILNRAYIHAAGKPLPWMDAEDVAEAGDLPAAVAPYSIDDALQSLFLDTTEIEAILLLWRAKKNVVLQGPPGVGKSFAATKLAFALMGQAARDRVEFVQFHQSYSYEDFVEGFRPTEQGFKLEFGKFVQFCRRAEADPSNTYVFVIDEINRGNLSKILGELMLLIESDKRGPEWAIKLASGNVPFHVPANVHLMGLMNTADRSLAVVDYALRRRFAFVDLRPKLRSPKFKAHLQSREIGDAVIELLVDRVEALNQEIIADTINLGSGFAIGHSFFCGKPMPSEDDRAWFRRVIHTEVAPLLREYWYDAEGRATAWEARLLEGL